LKGQGERGGEEEVEEEEEEEEEEEAFMKHEDGPGVRGRGEGRGLQAFHADTTSAFGCGKRALKPPKEPRKRAKRALEGIQQRPGRDSRELWNKAKKSTVDRILMQGEICSRCGKRALKPPKEPCKRAKRAP